jgi:hypothetical protein
MTSLGDRQYMDEPALSFEKTKLSPQKELVRLFYKEMWDHADKSLIPTIFHPGFTFRGSLGPSLVGYDEFAGYVDWVTGVFGQYTTDILALIEEENRVSGKMRFHGFHCQEVSGCRQAAVTFGGQGCRSSHSTAARFATSTFLATFMD